MSKWVYGWGRPLLAGLFGLHAVFAWQAVSAGEVKIKKETWNWAKAMADVAKRHKGDGVPFLPMGDSITYANQSGRYARMGAGRNGQDAQTCKWMNADKNDKSNGWWLAAQDVENGRSHVAASGVTSKQYIDGGKANMPPLSQLLKDFNPRFASILLGTNDLNAGVPPGDYLKNMEIIYKACLDNGTVPVVQTIPPTTWDKGGNIQKYNDGLYDLAKKYKLPLIDVNGEFLKRRPGETWKGTLVSNDGAHLTHEKSEGPATEDNLNSCGCLLRCWLQVQKAAELRKIAGVK